MDSSLKALAIKKLAIQLIKTGFIINKFFVKAKAKNIAVIGVREHPATKAPIPAKMCTRCMSCGNFYPATNY